MPCEVLLLYERLDRWVRFYRVGHHFPALRFLTELECEPEAGNLHVRWDDGRGSQARHRVLSYSNFIGQRLVVIVGLSHLLLHAGPRDPCPTNFRTFMPYTNHGPPGIFARRAARSSSCSGCFHTAAIRSTAIDRQKTKYQELREITGSNLLGYQIAGVVA